MAKVAGEIEATDRGLSPSDVDTPTHVCMDARLPVQPEPWAAIPDNRRYRIQASRQLTMDAGTTITETWNGWNTTSGDSDETGALAAAWKDYDGTGTAPAHPVSGFELETADFSYSTSEPRHAASPGGVEAYVVFQSDVAEGEILAINLEMENDLPFALSTPSSTRNYETIGRNTGTWAPYAANRSCSAWLMQRIIAQNLNKILYETKQYWTVPL